MALVSAVAIAGGQTSDSGSPSGDPSGAPAAHQDDRIPTRDLAQQREALPCTAPDEPINFEIFSAGAEVAGLPLTATTRRCDVGAPADEAPANRITYIYGDCEVPAGATGCAPPLQVQTWPACQRSKADYSFEGKPIPTRRLARRGQAEVVELNFALESRIEVYTKDSTVVIFADSPELAREAIENLTPQEKGSPPKTSAAELRGTAPPESLAAPSDGATEGRLKCRL